MKYKALKNCKFDRQYSVGEIIDGSVIDPHCLPRAIKFRSIEEADTEEVELVEEADTEEEAEEAQEAPETDSAEEDEEEPHQKRRGRKKADKGA